MNYQRLKPYHISGGASRLTVSDHYFVTADDALHRRKSITAFAAPKRFAQGRGDDVRRFMDWAVGLGANEFRVFSRVDWVGPPGAGVETGWEYDEAACHEVLIEAARRGCYVEVVAHTGPFNLDAMVRHLQAVDELCLGHENALLEVTNEPQVNSIPIEALLARYAPRTPGWASGRYDQTPWPAGQSVTTHTDRKDEWPRCFKDAFEFDTGQGPYVGFVPGFHGPIMLDEPPQVERTAVADDWKAYGAGAALFACGATMHSNPSLQRCEVPTDANVVACIRAFYEGLDLVPLQRYHGYEHPDDRGSLRRYRRFGEDGRTYEISVRPFEFKQV